MSDICVTSFAERISKNPKTASVQFSKDLKPYLWIYIIVLLFYEFYSFCNGIIL
jgi:hypothetical protein